MLGTALVLEARSLRALGELDAASQSLATADRLASELHQLNYREGICTSSGVRESAANMALSKPIADAGREPQFDQPSQGLRCSSIAAALIMNTFLAEDLPDASHITERSEVLAKNFVDLFFDSSKGNFRPIAGQDVHDDAPWRAVDQAMAILACKR